MLDVASTLGLSNTVMRLIEKRNAQVSNWKCFSLTSLIILLEYYPPGRVVSGTYRSSTYMLYREQLIERESLAGKL